MYLWRIKAVINRDMMPLLVEGKLEAFGFRTFFGDRELVVYRAAQKLARGEEVGFVLRSLE